MKSVLKRRKWSHHSRVVRTRQLPQDFAKGRIVRVQKGKSPQERSSGALMGAVQSEAAAGKPPSAGDFCWALGLLRLCSGRWEVGWFPAWSWCTRCSALWVPAAFPGYSHCSGAILPPVPCLVFYSQGYRSAEEPQVGGEDVLLGLGEGGISPERL